MYCKQKIFEYQERNKNVLVPAASRGNRLELLLRKIGNGVGGMITVQIEMVSGREQ